MILVALGTQKFQMARLLKKIEELAMDDSETFFVQKGNTEFIPKNCEWKNFVDASEFQELIEKCDMLITHSGVGTIMRGINAGKPIIVVPRLAKFHEHVDDHQVQIADAFAMKRCVLKCEDLERLEDYIKEARSFQFEPYRAPKNKVEDIILEFLDKQ